MTPPIIDKAIPTDNLYKFMALAGLAFAILFIVLINSRIESLTNDTNAVSKSLAEADATEKVFEENSKPLETDIDQKIQRLLNEEKILDEASTNPATTRLAEDTKTHMKTELVDVEKERDDVQKMERDENAALIPIIVAAKEANNQVKEATKTAQAELPKYFWFLLVAFAISAYNFRLWLVRVQRPQDTLLQLQLEEELDKQKQRRQPSPKEVK